MGLEASVDLFNVSFYFGSNGNDLNLTDLAGWESGVQGGTSGLGGSGFVGWKMSGLSLREVYKGFSFGASIGILPFDANVYTGYSAFIYKNYDNVNTKK